MKTNDTTEAMPSAIERADFTDNDLWERYFDLFEVFDLHPRLIWELLAHFPAHLEWHEVLDMIGRELAEMEGYPSTINDQQPYDMQHTCPLSLSPDTYDTSVDHEVAMRLYWLWACSIIHHCKSKGIDAINRHIRFMNIRLVHTFMGRSKESAFRLINSIDWLNILRIQHGLHDMPSGQLIDREEYTLRQLILEFMGLSGVGRLITGDDLDTSAIKATLFRGQHD
jgi:hypothetical protein